MLLPHPSIYSLSTLLFLPQPQFCFLHLVILSIFYLLCEVTKTSLFSDTVDSRYTRENEDKIHLDAPIILRENSPKYGEKFPRKLAKAHLRMFLVYKLRHFH